MTFMKADNNRIRLALILSLTLGLAPFNPPHIIGKLQWILGGNAFSPENGMQFQDWFDVLLHGLPWLLLLISALLNINSKAKKEV